MFTCYWPFSLPVNGRWNEQWQFLGGDQRCQTSLPEEDVGLCHVLASSTETMSRHNEQ